FSTISPAHHLLAVYRHLQPSKTVSNLPISDEKKETYYVFIGTQTEDQCATILLLPDLQNRVTRYSPPSAQTAQVAAGPLWGSTGLSGSSSHSGGQRGRLGFNRETIQAFMDALAAQKVNYPTTQMAVVIGSVVVFITTATSSVFTFLQTKETAQKSGALWALGRESVTFHFAQIIHKKDVEKAFEAALTEPITPVTMDNANINEDVYVFV
ncbi:hypothetical protein PROFUN_07765, partial [Planoprotostelium fungivorum]